MRGQWVGLSTRPLIGDTSLPINTWTVKRETNTQHAKGISKRIPLWIEPRGHDLAEPLCLFFKGTGMWSQAVFCVSGSGSGDPNGGGVFVLLFVICLCLFFPQPPLPRESHDSWTNRRAQQIM